MRKNTKKRLKGMRLMMQKASYLLLTVGPQLTSRVYYGWWQSRNQNQSPLCKPFCQALNLSLAF